MTSLVRVGPSGIVAVLVITLILASCGDDGVDVENFPPTAPDFAVEVFKNESLSATLPAADPDGDPLTFSLVTEPTHGSVSLSTVGGTPRATYTPDPGYAGPDGFTYGVTDGVESDQGSVTIQVIDRTPTLSAPGSVPRSATGGAPVSFDVSASDADGDPVTFEISTQPVNGTVELTATAGGPAAAPSTATMTLTYTPDEGYLGADVVGLRVFDGRTRSPESSVQVRLNEPPLPTPLQVTTTRNGAVVITLLAVDADGDPTTFEIAEPPALGALSDIDGTGPNEATVTYTPPGGFGGVDVFTYRALDALDGSDPAEVEIFMDNALPVVEEVSVATGRRTPVTIELEGTDGDADPLTFQVVDGPEHGTVSVPRSTGAGSAEVTYTPSGDHLGPDPFTVAASDGVGLSAPALVTVLVENQVPTADDQARNVSRVNPTELTLTGTDGDGDPLTFEILTQPTNGFLGEIDADGDGTASVFYTPNGSPVEDAFTFRVSDGLSASGEATVTLGVGNITPIAGRQTVEASKNAPTIITLSGTDEEFESLTFTIASGPTSGSLTEPVQVTPFTATVTYTPDTGFDGEDGFRFQVNDGHTTSPLADVTVVVLNQAPEADEPEAVEVETGGTVVIELTGTDADGDPLAFFVVSAPTEGSVLSVVETGSGSADVTYEAGPDAGTVTFEMVANDGTDDSEPVTVTVEVLAPNQPPTADDQELETPEDTPLDITLTGADPEDLDLVFTIVTPPANGSLGVLTEGGTPIDQADVTYTPDLDFSGTDSFVFQVEDDEGETATGTITITVDPVNDAPTFQMPPVQVIPGGLEGNPGPLRHVKVVDPDAGSGTVLVNLVVASGTIVATSGNGVVVTGSGTSNVSFEGTVEDVNEFFKDLHVTFNPPPSPPSSIDMTATVDDQGNSGVGGPLTGGPVVVELKLTPPTPGSPEPGTGS